MFEIAIIGAGPAGSTAARLLGPHCRVALMDKRDLECGGSGADEEKACGGLLAPDAQRAMAELSLGLPRSVVVDPQLFAVRSIDLRTGLERRYQRHYINIDRLLFDRWLYSLVPGGVAKFPHCAVRAVEDGPRAASVRYVKDGFPGSLEARIVIGADGARSLLRSAVSGPEKAQRYLAVQEWFPRPAGPPYYSALFDPAVTDFYAWTIPKNGDLILGAALHPGSGPVEKLELLKCRLRDFGLSLSRPRKRRSAFLLRPRGPGSVALGSGRLALAGEAAGLVSPSSGEGLSFALESAALLSEAILKNGEDFMGAYARAASGLRRTILMKVLKAAVLYEPHVRRGIMQSGIRSITVRTDRAGGMGKDFLTV